MSITRCIITGGAGFIGSHFIDVLLDNKETELVTIFDNFCNGHSWHYAHHINDKRLKVVCDTIENISALSQVMDGHDTVIHLASNADIAKASTDPTVDFWQGTALTNCVLEAMRITGTKRLLYASGSGVYGDHSEIEFQEDYGPLLPISTYGASKLAGESLIHSYCCMFGISAVCFRFANVVGERQTHGVCYDFIKKLLKDPTILSIWGNGTQDKSYIYVKDVVNAVLLANEKLDKSFEVYNVATEESIIVKEIAELVVVHMKLSNIKFEYTGGNCGFLGDVPIIKLSSKKIRKLGWKNSLTTKEAISKSILDMLKDIDNGKMKL